MKRYVNRETGQWYQEGESMTRRLDDGSVFSGIPTEEQLEAWGYELFEPMPAPVMTEEEETREEWRQRLMEIEEELKGMDYLTSKYVDGEDMTKYGDWQGRRRLLREEYRTIKSLIEEEPA